MTRNEKPWEAWQILYRKGGLTIQRSPFKQGAARRLHIYASYEYETDFSLGALLPIGTEFLEACEDLAKMINQSEGRGKTAVE